MYLYLSFSQRQIRCLWFKLNSMLCLFLLLSTRTQFQMDFTPNWAQKSLGQIYCCLACNFQKVEELSIRQKFLRARNQEMLALLNLIHSLYCYFYSRSLLCSKQDHHFVDRLDICNLQYSTDYQNDEQKTLGENNQIFGGPSSSLCSEIDKKVFSRYCFIDILRKLHKLPKLGA